MASTLPVWYIEAGLIDGAGKFQCRSTGSAVIVGVRKTGESGLKRMLLTAQHVLRTGADKRSGPFHTEIRAWAPQTGYNTDRGFIRVDLFTDLAPDAAATLINAEDLAFLELPASHGSLVCNILDDKSCEVGVKDIMISGYPGGTAYLAIHNFIVDPSEHPEWTYAQVNAGLGAGILAPGDAPPQAGASGGGVFLRGLYAGVYRGEFNTVGQHLFLPIPWIRQWCSARGYELFSEGVKPDTSTGAYYSEAMDALREACPSLANLAELAGNLNLPLRDADYNKALFNLAEDLAASPSYRQGIQLASTLRPGAAKLKALAQRLLPPAPPAPPTLGVYDYAVFGESEVMVNRRFLRDSVKGIETYESQRVVIVKGSPLSGRSYSRHLIKHIARHLGMPLHWFRLKDILMAQGDDNPVGVAPAGNAPWELARMLVDDVLGTANAAPPLQQTETEARWIMTQLPMWTIAQLRAAPGKRWIVVEGFDQELISEHVYNYLCWTASMIETPLPGIRMAFLGYDRPVPSVLADAARLDETSHFQRQDLTDFFANLAQQCGKQLDPASMQMFVNLCWNEYVNDLAADAGRPAPVPGELPARDTALFKLNKRLKGAIADFR